MIIVVVGFAVERTGDVDLKKIAAAKMILEEMDTTHVFYHVRMMLVLLIYICVFTYFSISSIENCLNFLLSNS